MRKMKMKMKTEALNEEVAQTTLRQVRIGVSDDPAARASEVARDHYGAAWAQAITVQKDPLGEGFRCTVVTGADQRTAAAALRHAAELLEHTEVVKLPWDLPVL